MMPTAYDPLTGQDVDTSSEAWRHSCECRWLLTHKPTRADKHMHLYGVPDRRQLFDWNPRAAAHVLAEDYRKRWRTKTPPLMHFRGLEAADRLLADAKRLYDLQQKP